MTGQPVPAFGDEPSLAHVPWTRDMRLLLVIAGPNLTSTVAQTLMSLVDFAVVSQLPAASQAQAAVNAGGLVFFVPFAFLLGTMVCVTTVVSQSYGAARPRDCSAYAWQGLWFSALFGIVAVGLIPGIPGLYRFIGHEPVVQAMETDYTQIRLLSLGFAGMTVALANYFNGIHRPMVNATSVVGATALNLVLTYGLVLGKLGMPALGVAGAAWGTVVATGFRTAWLLAAMCFGPSAARYQARHTWRLDADKMRRLVRIGWPAGLQFVVEVLAWSLMTVWLVGKFGTVHLAATAVIGRYTELSFMPAVGIGIAVSTLVGRSIGEGRPDLARRRARLGAAVSMSYMSLMGLVFVLFGRRLMHVFSDDPPVIELGTELFILAAIFQLFDAVAINYSHALRGAGDTRWPAIVGAMESWLIVVLGGWVVTRWFPHLGARGPWLCATVFLVCFGVTLYVRWRRGRWEQLDVIGRHMPAPDGAEPLEAGPGVLPVEPVLALGDDPSTIGSPTDGA